MTASGKRCANWGVIVSEHPRIGLFAELDRRIEIERQESDSALCDSLMRGLEQTIKHIALLLVALLPDDELGNSERYRWEYALFRTPSIGGWVSAIQGLAGGAFYSALSNQVDTLGYPAAIEQLTARAREGEWQYRTAIAFASALDCALGTSRDNKPRRASLLNALQSFVQLRNKLDAHGAPRSVHKSEVASWLEHAFQLVRENLEILDLPIVHCRQPVGGGRPTVIAIAGRAADIDLDRITKDRRPEIQSGVFVVLGEQLRRTPLLHAEPDLGDFYFANGDARVGSSDAEMLSYVSGRTKRLPITDWTSPPDRVVRSETAGLKALVPRHEAFTNAPDNSPRYIERPSLQQQLFEALSDSRRLIITLQGRGGVGKTSLALRAVDEASKLGWFDVVLWFSARDIDLGETGPSFVDPDVLTLDDLARQAHELLSDLGGGARSSVSPSDWMAQTLQEVDSGRVLWVLDNFETLRDPVEIFAHFDKYIQPPHKVLITTRHREFVGDYPIVVGGMTRAEFEGLVSQEMVRLSLDLKDRQIDDLFTESRGHPYVAKILMGEMRMYAQSAPKRLLQRREDVLDALFERTFGRLSRGARHVFLLLSTWRSLVPAMAIDIVVNSRTVTEDSSEQIDTEAAIDELQALSLVQVVIVEDEPWLDVPLPAWLFARRKLTTDHERIAVEAESELLQLFGPTTSTDLRHGLIRPARRFWESARSRLGDSSWLDVWSPWIERIARRVPDMWSWVAEDLEDLGRHSEAESYLRRAVEVEPSDPDLWLRLARHYETREMSRQALQAWVARALVTDAQFDDIAFAANKVNGWLKRERVELNADDKRALVRPLIDVFERRSDEADAQAFSRLAWLYVNVGERESGLAAAERGLALDPDQIDCRKFVQRMGSSRSGRKL